MENFIGSLIDINFYYKILEFLLKGGIFMIPLYICGFVTFIIILKKVIELRVNNVLPKRSLLNLREQIENDKIKLSKIKTSDRHPVGRIILHGISVLPTSNSLFLESLRDQGRKEKYILEKKIFILDIIANLSPFFGILGTILGMVIIFENLSFEDSSKLLLYYNGISQSIITSVVGFTIGIVAFIASIIFSRKVNFLLIKIEDEVLFFHSKLYSKSSK